MANPQSKGKAGVITFGTYCRRHPLIKRRFLMEQWLDGRLPRGVGASWHERGPIGLGDWARRQGIGIRFARRLYERGRTPAGVFLGIQAGPFVPRYTETRSWWEDQRQWDAVAGHVTKLFMEVQARTRLLERELGRAQRALWHFKQEFWVNFGKTKMRMRKQYARLRYDCDRIWTLIRAAERARKKGLMFLDEATFAEQAAKALAAKKKRRNARIAATNRINQLAAAKSSGAGLVRRKGGDAKVNNHQLDPASPAPGEMPGTAW